MGWRYLPDTAYPSAQEAEAWIWKPPVETETPEQMSLW